MAQISTYNLASLEKSGKFHLTLHCDYVEKREKLNMSEFTDKIREITTDAIAFWEKGRLLYNGILLLVVLLFYVNALVKEVDIHYFATIVAIYVLAIMANILYCVSYIVDFFMQLSAFQGVWRKRRWMLLATGVILGAVLAAVASHDIFRPLFLE